MNKFFILSFFLLITTDCWSQDFLSWEDSDKLWNHVISMPQTEKEDYNKIISYLKKSVKDERELIEVIYYWMADNIEYDIQGFLNNNIKNTDAKGVLKSKKSVCEGFAQLFKRLCEEAGIECVKISGISKGYGYNGEKSEETNHAWNAVKLNGEWKLIDSTWGSGYAEIINDSLVYKKNLNLGYLFSKPDGFVIEHFPKDPKWQLLEKPITIDEFYSEEMDNKIEKIYMYLR